METLDSAQKKGSWTADQQPIDALSSTTRPELWTAVNQFSDWLGRACESSFDPYDILGTAYGLWARGLYYRKNPLGTVLTAPLILMEILAPELRALFVSKRRYPTADAQLAL